MVATTPLASTFEEAYAEYSPLVRRLARRRLAGRGLEDDVVQETFLRAYRAWHRLEPGKPVWPWLKTIANNTCTDILRVRRTWAEQSREEPPEVAVGEDPLRDFVSHGRRAGIADALCRLNDRQRDVVVAVDFDGRSVTDLADQEGADVEAVKGVLKRGRARFRTAYMAIAEERGLLGALGLAGLAVRRAWRWLRPRGAAEAVIPAAALAAVLVVIGGALSLLPIEKGAETSPRLPADTHLHSTASGATPLEGRTRTATEAAETPSRGETIQPRVPDVPADVDVDVDSEPDGDRDTVGGRVTATIPGHEGDAGGTYDLYCDESPLVNSACGLLSTAPD